jgi:uncharacterized membrane-anchored protein
MKTLRLVLFIVVALIQLGVPASGIWKRQQTLGHGRLWKFRTAPVDPVDAFRGRYIALRFEAEQLGPDQTGVGKRYVALREDTDGFAQIENISAEPLKGDNVILTTGRYYSRINFPFDRYWVTEKDAVAADKAYAENSRGDKKNAYVTVRVRDGDAAIEELYLDGQPLKEYLRTHPQK